MQLPGEGVWGPSRDHDEAIRVLQRAVELGVNFIDTADSYGPFVAEELIREALHPYPDDLVIATKAGLARTGPGEWHPIGRPEVPAPAVRAQPAPSRPGAASRSTSCIASTPRSRWPSPSASSSCCRTRARSATSACPRSRVDELKEAQKTATIVSVQNLYNLTKRTAEDLLDHCEAENIGFIPWFPLATGKLAADGGPLDEIASEIDAKPSQIALAWLLRRSPVMLPIPGTSTVAHLEDNLAAASIELTDEQFETLNDLAG